MILKINNRSNIGGKMSTSKTQNNKLAVTVAASSRYKIQKNGVIRKLMSTGVS